MRLVRTTQTQGARLPMTITVPTPTTAPTQMVEMPRMMRMLLFLTALWLGLWPYLWPPWCLRFRGLSGTGTRSKRKTNNVLHLVLGMGSHNTFDFFRYEKYTIPPAPPSGDMTTTSQAQILSLLTGRFLRSSRFELFIQIHCLLLT